MQRHGGVARSGCERREEEEAEEEEEEEEEDGEEEEAGVRSGWALEHATLATATDCLPSAAAIATGS